VASRVALYCQVAVSGSMLWARAGVDDSNVRVKPGSLISPYPNDATIVVARVHLDSALDRQHSARHGRHECGVVRLGLVGV
jgi:hypothetical protein